MLPKTGRGSLFVLGAWVVLGLAACKLGADDDSPVIEAETQPLETVGPSTYLHVRVVDQATGETLPAHLSLFDAKTAGWMCFGQYMEPGIGGQGKQAREVGTGGVLANWHGFSLWRGEGVIPVGERWFEPAPMSHNLFLPYGRYRLVADRGLEYELAETIVDLGAGKGVVWVEFRMRRVVDTSGYLGADLHVHQDPSDDSTLPAESRLKSLVVAGVEVAVAADHDFYTDLRPAARALWPAPHVSPPVATIVGDEVSASQAHFNVFPVVPVAGHPRQGAPEPMIEAPPAVAFQAMRQMARSVVIQANHPRALDSGYFTLPACGDFLPQSGGALPACPLDFDALEVLNGYYACGSEILRTLTDWYALLRADRALTATGSSDSHGVSRQRAGFPRTYVRVGTKEAEPEEPEELDVFDERVFVEAIRAHRVTVTTGPFVTLRAAGGEGEGDVVAAPKGRLAVTARVQAPSWVPVSWLRLLVDGQVVKQLPVPARAGKPVDFTFTETLELEEDAFVTAEAWGHKAMPYFLVGQWAEILKDPAGKLLCPPLEGQEPGMATVGVTNPLFVDGDGDGKTFAGPVPILQDRP